MTPNTDGCRRPPGAAAVGFDFTLHVGRLCGDVIARLPELRHVDLSRVAISFCQTRKAASSGVFASLTPLRFAGGHTEIVRRGRRWGIQRLFGPGGRDMLYLLQFYLPRFLDLEFREKLDTVVHELWHVGPRFDGDLRRFSGRCYAHSGSRKRFDRQVQRLVDRWFALDPPEPLYAFLRYDFPTLVRRYGKVFGQRIRAPKLVPLS
jgi:predicted metallopeptidase